MVSVINIKEILNKKSNIVLIGIMLVMLLLGEVAHFVEHPVFMHDDICHLQSYELKLSTEGRWINYLLFPLLRYIDGDVALCFGIAGFCYFCYRILRNLWGDRVTSLVGMVYLFFSVAFVRMMDSSCTAWTMYLAGAVAAYMGYRTKSRLLFFIACGIVFNGIITSLYFALPLLFLKEDNKGLLRVLLYWILGFVIGHCIAQLMTYILCGQFITLAEWRRPNYVTGISSLVTNVEKSCNLLTEHVSMVGSVGIWLLVASLLAFGYRYRRDIKRGGILLVFLLTVALAPYAQAVPVGIDVVPRTSYCLYLSVMLLPLLAFRRSGWIASACMLLVGGSCCANNMKYLEQRNIRKQSICQSIEQLEIPAKSCRYVVLLPSYAELAVWGNNLGGGPISPIDWSEGPRKHKFHIFHGCYSGDTPGLLKKQGIDVERLNFREKSCYLYAIEKNILILKLNPKYFR